MPPVRRSGTDPLLLAEMGLHRHKGVWSGSGCEYDRAHVARLHGMRSGALGARPAYDGRFYTGVHTTGIYCRPVCPVRPARSANVSFFPSAAAAEAAGFRPCLRCRPETAPFPAPGSAAGRPSSGAAAHRRGGSPRSGGSHRGAPGPAPRHGLKAADAIVRAPSPGQPFKSGKDRTRAAGQTPPRRDRVPMTEIAMRAGFGSLRRFNAVFAQVYGRPPTRFGARGNGGTPKR